MTRATAPLPSHDIPFAEASRVWARIALLSCGGPAGQIALLHRTRGGIVAGVLFFSKLAVVTCGGGYAVLVAGARVPLVLAGCAGAGVAVAGGLSARSASVLPMTRPGSRSCASAAAAAPRSINASQCRIWCDSVGGLFLSLKCRRRPFRSII